MPAAGIDGSALPPGQGAVISTLTGPVTGVGPETLTVTLAPRVNVTLGCVGTGMVWFTAGPVSSNVVCGGPGIFAGSQYDSVPVRQGQRVTAHVRAPATAAWELRIVTWTVTPLAVVTSTASP